MRKMYFNGSFYSNDINELNKIFNYQNENPRRGNPLVLAPDLNEGLNEAGRHRGLPVPIIAQIRAIIVPHAGYVYSGVCANEVYRLLNGDNFKRVIVIGPSHRVYFRHASICLESEYETPLGNIDIDIDYSEKIVEKFNYIKYIKKAHGEHSTEVQMPFIKNYLKKSKVIEIVYGDMEFRSLSKIVEFLIEDKDNLLVISTDLSHFYSEIDAKVLDTKCMKAIDSLNLVDLNDCEACGLIGVKALVDVAKNKKLNSRLIDYRTSAKVNGDKDNVVGYMSALVFN